MFRKSTATLAAAAVAGQSIYDFEVKDARHKPYDLKQHKGHPLLIYNVASQCGLTNTGYTTATALYNKYKDQGFTVLAFPCNQFGAQEPGSEAEVKEMACKRFKADFPILEKVEVNGPNAHPLYKYLKAAAPGMLGSTEIKWNFASFLVDGEGKALHRFAPGAPQFMIERQLAPLLQKNSKL